MRLLGQQGRVELLELSPLGPQVVQGEGELGQGVGEGVTEVGEAGDGREGGVGWGGGGEGCLWGGEVCPEKMRSCQEDCSLLSRELHALCLQL